jgi:hypothetical protein
MKAKILSAVLVAAGAVPLLMASAPASATLASGTQITRYAGSACQPTDASNAAHARVDNSGRIFNTSPTDVLAVSCTVVRDQFGGKSAKMRVYAIDQKQAPGSSLSCTFSMSNPVTGQVNAKSLFGTGDAPSSPSLAQPIESTVLTAVNQATLKCLIPHAAPDGTKQAGIGGYDFSEFSS